MKNSTLAQATLLALTRQNVTKKKGPLSTYTVRARCIRRNIREGETVIVQKNNEGEINRLSDMIHTAGNTFFVDDKNRFYERVSSGNILRVRDGLSGEVIDQGEHAYKFTLSPGVMGYCITPASENNNREIWRFVYSDGSKTQPIELPYTGTTTLRFGYRNGVLALCSAGGGSKQTIWTYTREGRKLYTLEKAGAGLYPYPGNLFPITETAVGVEYSYSVGLFTQMNADGYQVVYQDRVDDYGYLYRKYHSASGSIDNTVSFIGADQNYFYGCSRLHNEENTELINEWAVCKFAIDDYDGAEEITRFFESPTFTSIRNPDHVNVRYGGASYVVNRATMEQAYGGLLDLSRNDPIYLWENDGYIWDKPSGIYQKTSLGTVMWPSSIYPKTSPFGQLGYALYGVTVGSIGEAIILFS